MLNIIPVPSYDVYRNNLTCINDRMLWDYMDTIDVLAVPLVRSMVSEVYHASVIDKFTVEDKSYGKYCIPGARDNFRYAVCLTYVLSIKNTAAIREDYLDKEVLGWLCNNVTADLYLIISYGSYLELDVDTRLKYRGEVVTGGTANGLLYDDYDRWSAFTKDDIERHLSIFKITHDGSIFVNTSEVLQLSTLSKYFQGRLWDTGDFNVRIFCNSIHKDDMCDKYYDFYYSLKGRLKHYVFVKYPSLPEMLSELSEDVPAMDPIGGIVVPQKYRDLNYNFFDSVLYNIRRDASGTYDIYNIASIVDKVAYWLANCDWGELEDDGL